MANSKGIKSLKLVGQIQMKTANDNNVIQDKTNIDLNNDPSNTNNFLSNDLYQLGFSTFLTTLSSPVSSLPGQYIGDSDPSLSLSGGQILTETELMIISLLTCLCTMMM